MRDKRCLKGRCGYMLPTWESSPRTGMGHHFTFQVIKLWELPPEVAKQPCFEVLLSLLPLTKGGKNFETVDDMINELVSKAQQRLIPLVSCRWSLSVFHPVPVW
jgi:hypothetical protein